jgi:hypothetical protein
MQARFGEETPSARQAEDTVLRLSEAGQRGERQKNHNQSSGSAKMPCRKLM